MKFWTLTCSKGTDYMWTDICDSREAACAAIMEYWKEEAAEYDGEEDTQTRTREFLEAFKNNDPEKMMEAWWGLSNMELTVAEREVESVKDVSEIVAKLESLLSK